MYRTIETHPYHLRYATRVVAISFVDLRFQCRFHVARFEADHWQACFGKNAEKPLRHWPGFQSDALEAVSAVRQHLKQSFGFSRYLQFSQELAGLIHNADARLLD